MMYRFSWLAALTALLMMSACTEANPAYVGGGSTDGPGSRRDSAVGTDDGGGGGRLDGAKPRPDAAPLDQRILPDVVPPVCGRDEDCNDNRPCTVDRCDKKNQVCTNELDKNKCLIGGRCYDKDDSPSPTDSCRSCDPDRDPRAWSAKRDGDSCSSDGLSCTKDVCSAGKCTHEPEADTCLVGGKCLKVGDPDPSGPCRACVPPLSQTATSFIAGSSCRPSGGGVGFCAANACKAVADDPTGIIASASVRSSALHGVARIPGGAGFWAVGDFTTWTSNTPQGIIGRLGAVVTPVTASQPMRAIHHRLAVGDGGVAYHYHNGTWSVATSLQTKLGGKPRYAVWGRANNNVNYYYIGGTNNAGNEPGVWECSETSGSYRCTAATGFSKSAVIRGIFGTHFGSGFARAWAINVGAYEDIYYRAYGGSTKWSFNSPTGCFDGASTACDNTSSMNHAAIGGTSDKDVWAVGTRGLIVRYDGTSWKRVTLGLSDLSSYSFDAIYASSADGLMTLTAHRDTSNGRAVVLFNYNTKLDLWFGPIVVRTFGGTLREAVLEGIAGDGYKELWMVGRQPAAGSTTRYAAWVVRAR